MLNGYFMTLLRNATSLDLDQSAVDKAVQARMRARGISTPEAYAADIRPGSGEYDALIDEVVVPETWFFREAAAFAAACTVVADKVTSGVRPARILCLPCASGEEPYSLAIALLERGMAHADFVIHAMDVSAGALARAQRAVYRHNAFRGTSPAFRSRWFTSHADGYALLPEVRERVTFRRANLLELLPLPEADAYDIVFCRNLLIYFDEVTLRGAIERLKGLLNRDGVLFAGHAEAAVFRRHGFAMAPFPRAFALTRRTSRMSASSAPLPQRAPHGAPPSVPRVALARVPHAMPPPALTASLSMRPANLRAASPAALAAASHAPSPAVQQLLQKARGLADRGKLEEAEHAFQRYLHLAPESADAHFMLGLLREQLNKPAAAEASLRRAIYLDPDHYEALCHLALLREQRDATDAHAWRRRAARVFQRREQAGATR